MDRTLREYATIQAILLAEGITNRETLKARYDKRGGIAGLKGIGRKRRKLIEVALKGTDREWMYLFNLLPPYAAIALEGHAELPAVPGARVEWQPAEGLLEGHTLSVPDGV